ncbi:DUF551 domain-containing protein [Salmonella enterica]|nr:DUF551 domain-containing protein [Salmonella enterica]EAX3608707.1 DUF551 domain-containing protein [Salmonella enterica]EGW6278453.1 DUF551 domain-containing protein [Salmonella enterica]EGX3933363.1 DUF551 domain-containing protein [Salmonella enterica]
MTIDKRALREVAERATKGEWSVQFGDEIYSTDGVENQQIAMVFSINDESDAEFIAAANPATVLALLDELETKEEQRANWFRMAQKLGEDLDTAERLIAELDQRLIEYAGIATREARRVAELEARTVNLPKRSVGEVMRMSGFSRDYAEGWCAGNDNAISCSERMPDREYVLAGDFSGTHYLASIPNVQVGIYADWFDDEKPCWDDSDGNDLHLKEVTHWMPLPEPPQQ